MRRKSTVKVVKVLKMPYELTDNYGLWLSVLCMLSREACISLINVHSDLIYSVRVMDEFKCGCIGGEYS